MINPRAWHLVSPASPREQKYKKLLEELEANDITEPWKKSFLPTAIWIPVYKINIQSWSAELQSHWHQISTLHLKIWFIHAIKLK